MFGRSKLVPGAENSQFHPLAIIVLPIRKLVNYSDPQALVLSIRNGKTAALAWADGAVLLD